MRLCLHSTLFYDTGLPEGQEGFSAQQIKYMVGLVKKLIEGCMQENSK